MASQTHLPPTWRARLLHMIAAPEKPETDRFLDAWQRAEGGKARWNPLNTTYPLLGTTDYNSSGVKNYARATDGVCAQALTLVLSDYSHLLGDLQSGNYTAEQLVTRNVPQLSHWGTDTDLMLAILKGD